MKFRQYWSIQDAPLQTTTSYHVASIGAIICLFGWLWVKKFKKSAADSDRTIFLWGFGFMGVLCTTMFLYLNFIVKEDPGNKIRRLLSSPDVACVQGVISGFRREYRRNRYANVTIEHFYVDTVFFTYEDPPFARFIGFANTNNGVFGNGLPVRITYTHTNLGFGESRTPVILKVEIADQ